VSEDKKVRDDEKARVEALFRYRVIAPLLDRDEHLSLRQRVADRAATPHLHPSRGEQTVSMRTLWTWMGRFRQGSLEALHPALRKDKGTVRALSQQVLDRAEALRREVPTRWTSTVLDILRLEQTLPADKLPHRATLDRHFCMRGASRRQLAVLGSKRTCKMCFDAFGDLWVGDYHHGPLVLGPDGTATVAKLGAFIDHKTRYPVADRWYLNEELGSLRDTLLRALLRFGPPKVLTAVRKGVIPVNSAGTPKLKQC
jgi:hypothetical protein